MARPLRCYGLLSGRGPVDENSRQDRIPASTNAGGRSSERHLHEIPGAYRWWCRCSVLTSREDVILKEVAALAGRMVASGAEQLGLGAPGTAQRASLGGTQRPLCRRRVRPG